MASSSRFSEVEEEKITEIIDASIPENTKRIIQVSGHRNEGSAKVYCEKQTLQQEQCSEILAAPVASSTALITKSPQQVEDRNSVSC